MAYVGKLHNVAFILAACPHHNSLSDSTVSVLFLGTDGTQPLECTVVGTCWRSLFSNSFKQYQITKWNINTTITIQLIQSSHLDLFLKLFLKIIFLAHCFCLLYFKCILTLVCPDTELVILGFLARLARTLA